MDIYTAQQQALLNSRDGVFLIAEIGKNFIQTKEERPVSLYLENAKELVRAARDVGADAVKFQTHEVEDEVLDVEFTSPHFQGSDRYQWVKRNTEATPLLEFWKPLKTYCDEIGITFFSTPMSRKAAQKLEMLGVPFWKVGSGDVEDYLMLDFLIETGKPIIISTGMVGLQELDGIISYITRRGSPLVVLYCVSQYPAPAEYFNLATIGYLMEKYPDVVIGFSDHSLGHEVTLAAAKAGARVIEKHFSFSRDLWGADHKVSMTPDEFQVMARAIRSGEYRNREDAMYYGDKEKELEGVGNVFRPYFNKTLVAGTDIPKGTSLTSDMFFAVRPRMLISGEPPRNFFDLVGKKTKRNLKKYDPIQSHDIEYEI